MVQLYWNHKVSIPNLCHVNEWKVLGDAKYLRDGMHALAMSEFYGFARLGFSPRDQTVTEHELQQRHVSRRVPEFIAGKAMVEVKRIKLDDNFDIDAIVRKACEKASEYLVHSERVSIFYVCYVIPMTTEYHTIQNIKKIVRHNTMKHLEKVYVKKMKIMFAKAPDACFIF